MRIDVVLFGLAAVVASAIALLSWRRSRNIGRRLADLAAQCEKAESDKARLLRTVSLLEGEESERIARLEHDIKSPLGVILGFSSLLRESVELDRGTSPLPLKSINAIHQSATKILQTIDAAVKNKELARGHEAVDGQS